MVRNRARGFTLAVLFRVLIPRGDYGPGTSASTRVRKNLPGYDETDLAIHHPDLLAWKLFVEINAPANNGTNDVVWETWASDNETFPAQPDPANTTSLAGSAVENQDSAGTSQTNTAEIDSWTVKSCLRSLPTVTVRKFAVTRQHLIS